MPSVSLERNPISPASKSLLIVSMYHHINIAIIVFNIVSASLRLSWRRHRNISETALSYQDILIAIKHVLQIIVESHAEALGINILYGGNHVKTIDVHDERHDESGRALVARLAENENLTTGLRNEFVGIGSHVLPI